MLESEIGDVSGHDVGWTIAKVVKSIHTVLVSRNKCIMAKFFDVAGKFVFPHV